jgi:hypothetical protein
LEKNYTAIFAAETRESTHNYNSYKLFGVIDMKSTGKSKNTEIPYCFDSYGHPYVIENLLFYYLGQKTKGNLKHNSNTLNKVKRDTCHTM